MRKKKSLAVILAIALLSYFGANTKTGSQLLALNKPRAVYASAYATCPMKPSASSTLYCVEHVVDGDTLDLDMDGKRLRVRLIGINTPETVDPRRAVECFGKEASNKAKEILLGKWVSIETDPTQDSNDKYGRKLLYVYTEDGVMFNKQMIEDGYAYEYTYRYPYKYQKDFKAAEHEARTNERGLWSPNSCRGVK